MLKVLVDYPSFAEEAAVVGRLLGDLPTPETVMSIDELATYQRAARDVYIDREVAEYAVALVAATREPERAGVGEIAPYVEFGASPRGSINLVLAARALSLLRGRSYALPQDVRALAPDVLRHRIVLTYQALAEEVTTDQIVERIVTTVPMPRLDLARGAASA